MPAAAAIEDTVVDEGLNIRLPAGSLFYNRRQNKGLYNKLAFFMKP
jgi:hypothetical protein